MKVYVVCFLELHGIEDVSAVFDNRNAAESYVNRYGKSDYWILEREVRSEFAKGVEP
jgi:hypothetical protein